MLTYLLNQFLVFEEHASVLLIVAVVVILLEISTVENLAMTVCALLCRVKIMSVDIFTNLIFKEGLKTSKIFFIFVYW